jgi:hypothetical protein
MTKLLDRFNSMTAEQMADPVQLAKYFLEEISKLPGRKIGFIGQPQSGTTLAMHHLCGCNGYQKIGNFITMYDPRGIPDTFNTTLPYFEDLNEVVVTDIAEWMKLIVQAPENKFTCPTLDDCHCPIPSHDLVQAMVAKISGDVEESRKMLLWKAALNLFCLRDLLVTQGNTDPDAYVIFDLPYLPIEYNQYFEKLVLLKRRDNWFTDPLFLAHIEGEGVDEQAEKDLVAVRDQEIADCQTAGTWTFDYEIVNDGDQASLEAKLDVLVTNLTND